MGFAMIVERGGTSDANTVSAFGADTIGSKETGMEKLVEILTKKYPRKVVSR